MSIYYSADTNPRQGEQPHTTRHHATFLCTHPGKKFHHPTQYPKLLPLINFGLFFCAELQIFG